MTLKQTESMIRTVYELGLVPVGSSIRVFQITCIDREGRLCALYELAATFDDAFNQALSRPHVAAVQACQILNGGRVK